MKKIILGLVAATAVAAPLAMSAPANAYTVNTDGSLHVTKGEVQTTFKWNNATFDKNASSLEFSVDTTSTQTTHFEGVCGGTTYTGDLLTTITRATNQPTATWSDNGKQITGWDLNLGPATSSTDYAHSTLDRARNQYTMCKLLGGADGGSGYSLVKTDAPGTVTVTSTDGTRVLPLTPDAVPAA